MFAVRNAIPKGSESSIYDVRMSPDVTASSVDFRNSSGAFTELYYRIPLRNNAAEFSVRLDVGTSTNNGIAHALFSDTAVLKGVFLADGATPSLKGWRLSLTLELDRPIFACRKFPNRRAWHCSAAAS